MVDEGNQRMEEIDKKKYAQFQDQIDSDVNEYEEKARITYEEEQARLKQSQHSFKLFQPKPITSLILQHIIHNMNALGLR